MLTKLFQRVSPINLHFNFFQHESSFPTPYQRNINKFFNKLTENASQTKWQPNNLIFEETNDTFISSVKSVKNLNIIYFNLAFAITFCFKFYTYPYLAIFPMYYAFKHFTGWAILSEINKRTIQKIRLIDKQSMEVHLFSKEMPEIVLLNSLKIFDIDAAENAMPKKFFYDEQLKNYYFIRFEGKVKNEALKYYYLFCKKNDEAPGDRFQVLKAIFLESKGE